MRFSPLLFGVFWIGCFALLPLAAAGTVLQYTSTPENYVSRIPGHTLVPNPKTSFQLSSEDRGNTIYVSITEPAIFQNGVTTLLYTLKFSAPVGTALGLGTYDYPGVNATPTTPGFDFFGSQGISDPVSGRFHVTELTYDASGKVFSFEADFTEQDRNNADSCSGTIEYNSGQGQPVIQRPAVSVVATTATAGNSGVAPGVFTIQRTGATTTALTVSYTLGGKAVNGVDYLRLTGKATIKAGKATAGVKVSSLDLGTSSSKANVKLTLSTPPDGSYTVEGSGQARVTIHR